MTVEEHKVEAVGRCSVSNRDDWWAVDLVQPDGLRIRHVFPPEALHWRAAEYGYDPTDAARLLDVVLHERHIVGHTHKHPDFVYNTDRDTARAGLDARLDDVKTRVRVVDPDGLLARVVAEHVHDPKRHAELSAYVDHVRRHGAAPHREPGRG